MPFPASWLQLGFLKPNLPHLTLKSRLWSTVLWLYPGTYESKMNLDAHLVQKFLGGTKKMHFSINPLVLSRVSSPFTLVVLKEAFTE
ncbi:hypothetical protein WN943_003563 [Citrus x changshan-huyou]